MTEDERAIRQAVDEWMEASRAGDTGAVLELMTDDVIFMTPGREPFGKAEFRASSESMKGMKMDGRAEILELRILGDQAWIRNHIDLTITLSDDEAVRRSGYTLTVLEKGADSRWRLKRDANLVS